MQEEMSRKKILIVGGGVTGSYITSLIAKHYPSQVSLELWDKARGTGGRMSTTRMTRTSDLTCDLGAQYFSITNSYWEKHKSVHEELIRNGILERLSAPIEGMRASEEETKHFVAPNGSGSIPKYFLKGLDCDIKTSTMFHELTVSDSKAIGHGRFGDEEITCSADAVVITIPVPQILNLKGDLPQLLQPYVSKLEQVRYSSRYVLGLFFPNIRKIDGIDWSAKYIYDNPCIRYIAMDTAKRNKDQSQGLSMVVHTSVPFSIARLENSFDEVEPQVMEHLKELIPNLPEFDSKKFLRWRYSQVSEPYDKAPGCLVVKDTSPSVILAGDAFTQSNLDGCLSSGNTVFEYLKENLKIC